MAVSGSITIAPITAQIEGEIDKKVGYFVEINFNGVKKVTETIPGQAALKWATPLIIPLTDNDFAAPEIPIVITIATDDGKGKKEFFAEGSFKFSEVKSQAQTKKALSVSDKRKKQRGNITFEVVIKRDSKAGQPQQPQQRTATATTNKGPVGTLIIQPKSGLLRKSGAGAKKIEPSVIVVLGDQAIRTNPSEISGYSPIWKDVLSFELKGNEQHIIFRVIDSSANPGEETLGEALLPFQDLAEAVIESSTEFTIELEIKGAETGKLTVDAEYSPDVIPNPLKMYPPIEIKKGDYVCKKIRYANPDNIKKTISILPFDQSNLVQPRTSEISINPNSYSEIRFKIFAPTDLPEQRVRVDIFVNETAKTEETLIFDLFAI